MHCREVFATELHCSLCQNAPEVLGGQKPGHRGGVAYSHSWEEWREVSGPLLLSAALSLIEQVWVHLQSEPSSGVQLTLRICAWP